MQQQSRGSNVFTYADFHAAAEQLIAHCHAINIVAHNSTNVDLAHKISHTNTHDTANGIADAQSNSGPKFASDCSTDDCADPGPNSFAEQDANNAKPNLRAAHPNRAQRCNILQRERTI